MSWDWERRCLNSAAANLSKCLFYYIIIRLQPLVRYSFENYCKRTQMTNKDFVKNNNGEIGCFLQEYQVQ